MMDGVSVVIIVFVLVIAVPVGVLVSGAVGAALLGWLIKGDVDEVYEDTEYLELGR
jgi:hypothetical protein